MRRFRLRLSPSWIGAAAALVALGAIGALEGTLPQNAPKPAQGVSASAEAPRGRILWQFETGG